jgi:diaminohydroxyphosphoribosylaminopyrimidine deaminase/5-amino-6-(5-phosphoribosylamino)uracil reductase
MYVSLEPCAHFGLTPPCATRLVTEGIKNVIIANPDPFGKVNGKGIAILQEAGAAVTTGLLDKEGLWLNRRFFCAHTSKRPYIILKWAQNTDGFIGTADRQSVQISGPESMLLSHRWRTEEAAIMVGYTTALNDNPRLTARLHTGKQPLRIALDRRLSLPHSHHLFNEDAATWIITEGEETISGNVHYINLPFSDLLPALMSRLYDAKMLSLIVEGGAQLLNSFITSGLWDEARVFTGNSSIGNGLAAPTLSNDLLILDRSSGEDKLQVFLNKNNPYKYVTGMAL